MAIHKRLFFLLLIFLPTQLGFHFWPLWSFVLGRRVDYLSPTFYFTDILVVCILIFWALEYIKNAHVPRRVPHFLFSIVFFVLFAGINCYVAVSVPIAFYKWLKVVEYIGLGWYIVFTKIRTSDVVFPLALSVGYSSGIAIVQFIFQHSLGGVLWFVGERSFSIDTPGIARFNMCPSFSSLCTLILRPYGTFPHPNVLGGYIAAVSPIIIYQLFQKTISHRTMWIYRVVLGMGFVSLLLTFSRGAWVVALLTVIISAVASMQIYATRRKISTFTSIPSIFLYIGIVLSMVIYIFLPSVSDESVSRRIELQQAAVLMWQHSPFFGVGLGNFLVELPKYTHVRQANFLQPVHNVLILAISELGIVGLLCIGIVFGVIIKRTYVLCTRVNKSVVLVDILQVLPLCSLILLGAIDHYPVTLQQGQLVSVLIVAMHISRIL